GVVNEEFPAALLEHLHPAGYLHPLVDRLGRRLQSRRPVQCLAAVRSGHGELDAVHGGTDAGPQVDAQAAFGLQRGAEHALARHDLARGDAVRSAVGNDGDVVPALLQAERELQAGLAGADDEDLAHANLPLNGWLDLGPGWR